MGRTGYWSILITAAILAGSLVALPVWDFYHYGPSRAGEAPAASPSLAGMAGGLEPAPRIAAAELTTAPSRTPAQPVVASTPLPGAAPAPGRGDAPIRPRLPLPKRADARTAISAPDPTVVPAQPRAAGSPAGPRTGPDSPPAQGASPPPGATPAADRPGSIGWIAGGGLPGPPATPGPAPKPTPSNPDRTPPPAAPQPSEGSASAANAEEPGSLRLSLFPNRPSTPRGETLTVQVVLSGARDITSVPFHLQFDPEVLQYVGARAGPALNGRSLQPIFLASVNPTRPGDLAVGLSLVRSSGTFNGSGTILLLDFQALAPGRTDLQFDKASVRGPTSAPVAAEIAGSTIEVR
jgi:hypothetical protein